ncbi:glycine--tRNA ligase subunit beta [Carnobacteriaceae bacterium zg-ZUI240]|nr:glycine--tRNA ligase subunit beta [Carnobacteriaceae bacterium zg-ZUI240]
MAKDLLLEVGLEEVPAKYVSASIEQLTQRVQTFLDDLKLEYVSIEGMGTPRRFAVIVKGLQEQQADSVIVHKGPAKKIACDEAGNWTKAAVGFVSGKGLSVDDIYFEDIKGVEYVHVKQHISGEATEQLLPGLKDVIMSMTFPIAMTWGKHTFRYIRPIHWLIAQFGNTTIPFDILGVHTGTTTRGHRFLGNDTVVLSADAYESALAKEFVIVNLNARKAMIREQIQQLAAQNHWVVDIDEELLEEVTNIVEYPTAFYGTFDEKYLAVPDEVLITTMKEHQRYFYVKSAQGQLLPFFISVRNGNEQHLQNVAKGNEKVLVARLEDALFFTNEDAKIKIETAVKKLDNVNFHVKIGSIAQKMANVGQIVSILGEALEVDVTAAQEAAKIYKFDLVTNMVGEFPELQGIMGEKYALAQGYQADVAQAIREHYLPLSAEGALPESLAGSVLSLADKIDSLISFFKIGMVPTGSNDPYALRRSAIGIVRLLETNDWAIDLDELFSLLLNDVYGVDYDNQQSLLEQLHLFMVARVQQRLQVDYVRHDIIQSALEIDVFSVPFIIENARELQNHANDETFKETIEAMTRVVNLFDKSFEIEFELKPFDVSLAQTKSEVALHEAIEAIEDVTYETYVQLAPYITAFFEDNMVFVDDETIRNNRLCLISDVAQLILYYADPTKIVK